jgi:hypothetical protein
VWRCDLRQQALIGRQKLVNIARVCDRGVGVFDVEVVAVACNLEPRRRARLIGLDPSRKVIALVAPPRLEVGEFFDADGLVLL